MLRIGTIAGAVLLLLLESEPPGRNKPVAAFDPNHNALVVFGGYPARGPAIISDAWLWKNNTWTALENTQFAPRASSGVAVDSHRRRIVAFGGNGPSGALGDTVEWMARRGASSPRRVRPRVACRSWRTMPVAAAS